MSKKSNKSFTRTFSLSLSCPPPLTKLFTPPRVTAQSEIELELIRLELTKMRIAAFRFVPITGLAVVAIILPQVGGAQGNSAAGSGKVLTPEGSLNVRSISDLQFSPDGSRLALVVAEPPKEKGRARHIWLYEKSTGGVRQFTFSAKSESSPRWS